MALLVAVGSLFVTAAPASAAVCEWSNVTLTSLYQRWANTDATSTVYYQIGYTCSGAKSSIKVTKVVFYVRNGVAADPMRLEDTRLYRTSSIPTYAPNWQSTAVTSCTPPASGGLCAFSATRTLNYTYPYSATTYMLYGCACNGVGINGFWFGHRFIAHTGWTEARSY